MFRIEELSTKALQEFLADLLQGKSAAARAFACDVQDELASRLEVAH